MDYKSELTSLQRGIILSLMTLNACVPSIRLLIMFIELALSLSVDPGNLIFHVLIVPFQFSVVCLYLKGLVPLKVLGVLCSEITCIVFLILGNFVEPQLNQIWIIGSLYIAFFIQANLIESPVLKFLCYAKPLVGVLVCGLMSGTLSLKSPNEAMVVLSNLSFGVIGVYSFLASEEIKRELIAKLRETKQQLASIIAVVPAGIFVLTAQDELVIPNDACLSLLDCSDAAQAYAKLVEVQYKQGTRHYSEADQSLVQDLQHYIQSPSTRLADFGQSELASKTLQWLGQKTTWNSQLAVVVVIKDVTDVIQLERTKVESQFRNMMLRSVSHELKTPTNSILHSVQAVILGEDVPPWVKQRLQIAELSCRHLLFIISDLLDFSQLVSARFRLALANFEVRSTLDSCLELMKLIAERKTLRLSMRIDPLLPDIACSDSGRLCQVMLNLLSNAVKFTPRRGQINVLAVLNDQGLMEISVQDTGIGIAPENFDRLLHVFSRHEDTTTINPQGVGLGLHISNMLAVKLGGAPISVTSQLNVGTCFTFKVKMHNFAVEPYELSESRYEDDDLVHAQEVNFTEVKSDLEAQVIVVDDSSFNRLVVVGILATLSINCAEAESGQEAIDFVLRRAQVHAPVQVVVMDFEMPEMDGPTACRRMLAQLSELGLPTPKVIAHTAYTSEEDRRRCFDAGMIDFLQKPSSRDRILSAVMAHLA
jgi:signal transduction histidine kinase/ActR/RegA family two-component response regulator